MTLAAGFLPGAAGRLLPPSVPLRFFALAVVAHVAFWAVLGLTAEQLVGFRGGFAPLLAAVHLLTIGVLVSTAIGAAVQILPVVTRRTLVAVWPVRLVFWLNLAGLCALLIGFLGVHPGLTNVGAGLAAAGTCLFAIVLADNLRRASGPAVVMAYVGAALVALVVTVLIGVMLAFDFRAGGHGNHGALARAHLILGGFGAMGLFALGFSHVLVPMFTLAPAAPRGLAWAGFAAAAAAVTLAAAAAFGQSPVALVSASVLGLAACTIHLWLMRQALRHGLRRRLGVSFVLIRGAWVVLPMTVVLGAALLTGTQVPGGQVLVPVLLFAGWLLTFLLGVLQRILPMLASMHVPAEARRARSLGIDGGARRPSLVHACCHGLALAGIALGVVMHATALVQAGCVIGLIGAVAFAWGAAPALHDLGRAAWLPAPAQRGHAIT